MGLVGVVGNHMVDIFRGWWLLMVGVTDFIERCLLRMLLPEQFRLDWLGGRDFVDALTTLVISSVVSRVRRGLHFGVDLDAVLSSFLVHYLHRLQHLVVGPSLPSGVRLQSFFLLLPQVQVSLGVIFGDQDLFLKHHLLDLVVVDVGRGESHWVELIGCLDDWISLQCLVPPLYWLAGLLGNINTRVLFGFIIDSPCHHWFLYNLPQDRVCMLGNGTEDGLQLLQGLLLGGLGD